MKDVVFKLSKATTKEAKQPLIKKAEGHYKQAKDNLNAAKDDLSSYSGNRKKQFQQELKKLEQSISKTYSDFTQIRDNKEPAAGTTPSTPSASNNNASSSTGGNNQRKPSAVVKSDSNTDISSTSSSGNKKKPKKPVEDDDNIIGDVDGGDEVRPQTMKKGHEKVDQILSIYDESHAMADNMIRLGDEMITIGAAAAEKLKQQTERMNLIQKDLDDLGDGLKRAKKELRAFMRGTACDKAVVVCMILVIVLMVLVIIGWQVAKSVCIKGVTNTCIGGYTGNSTKSASFDFK